MKQLLTITLALLLVLSCPDPGEAQEAEEMPVTFYGSFGGSAALDQDAAVKSASLSLRFGIKTDMNREGSWRLITEYNSITRPLKKDGDSKYVKSLGIGAERIYWTNRSSGFLTNSGVVIRGGVDMELNLKDNDNNLAFGVGGIKKLSVDEAGNSNWAFQLSLDMLVRNNEEDDLSMFATLNFTPFQ